MWVLSHFSVDWLLFWHFSSWLPWESEYVRHDVNWWRNPRSDVILFRHIIFSVIVDSNMTSFKRFESKPVVKIILIYDRLNLLSHRQFITIFYQFLHIRIEIIYGSHMYISFLPRVGLYVSFLLLANARGKTLWHKGLLVIKNNIYIWLPWIIS